MRLLIITAILFLSSCTVQYETTRVTNLFEKLNKRPQLGAYQITVDDRLGYLTLEGVAESQDVIDKITTIAASVNGVVEIDSRIVVDPSKFNTTTR